MALNKRNVSKMPSSRTLMFLCLVSNFLRSLWPPCLPAPGPHMIASSHLSPTRFQTFTVVTTPNRVPSHTWHGNSSAPPKSGKLSPANCLVLASSSPCRGTVQEPCSVMGSRPYEELCPNGKRRYSDTKGTRSLHLLMLFVIITNFIVFFTSNAVVVSP